MKGSLYGSSGFDGINTFLSTLPLFHFTNLARLPAAIYGVRAMLLRGALGY